MSAPVVHVCSCCCHPIEIVSSRPIDPGVTSVIGDWTKLCAKCNERMLARTTIESRERKTAVIWVVEVDHMFKESDTKRGFRPRVSVWSKYELSDQMPIGNEEWKRVWTKAEVSWSSIGAVGVDEAERFGDAIRVATQHGNVMDREHGFE